MTRAYVATRPGRTENLRAAAVALCVAGGIGAIVFYLTRVVLAREVLEREVPPSASRATEADAEVR